MFWVGEVAATLRSVLLFLRDVEQGDGPALIGTLGMSMVLFSL